MADHSFYPQKDTQAYRLLELTAICGELPACLLHRIPGSTSYKDVLIWSLKKERLLKTYYRDRLRGYRLGTKGKAFLLRENPERFSFYLTGNADTNMLKSEITRRLRLHRIAEIYIMMVNAGISVFRDEKPDLFRPGGTGLLPTHPPAFYNSREVKELGMETIKIRGSRMAGVLTSPVGSFLIYNEGTHTAKWDYRAEQRAQALLQMTLCTGTSANDKVSGLLFGSGMEPFYQILSSADSNTRCFFLLDGNYEHFYYLTNDFHGEVMLKLLCDTGRRAELDRILSLDLKAGVPDFSIENDALDREGNPVLFGYLPDIPRVNRFLMALQLRERTGTLICFDFQAGAYAQYAGGRLRLQTISFEKFERRFYPSKKED